MLRTLAIGFVVLGGVIAVASAQPPNARIGEAVPRDVREMYDKGMLYLLKTQSPNGDWTGGQQGPGITGLGLMVFLASGEDPNFGLYSNNVRRAVRSIITNQNASTGYFGNSMYHHGFAMLGLAEAYGAVDDRYIWPEGKKQRSIGAALELAVRAQLHRTARVYQLLRLPRHLHMMIISLRCFLAAARACVDNGTREEGEQAILFPHVGVLIPVVLARKTTVADHERRRVAHVGGSP